MREYINFDLELSDFSPGGPERFKVHVRESPKGRQYADKAQGVEVPLDLRSVIRKLEERQLDQAGIIAFGEALSDLLLPVGGVRDLFQRSIESLGQDQGLRVRIITHEPELAKIPWEYVYISPPEMPARLKGPGGFFVLDPKLSVVRYETLEAPSVRWKPILGKVDLVAVLASTKGVGRPPLDLDREELVLRESLDDVGGVKPRILRPGTWNQFTEALKRGCDIFHFAGHGDYEKSMGEARGTTVGAGKLIFAQSGGGDDPRTADDLGKRLKGTSTRLAVLSACYAAQTDSDSPWSGVASSLIRSSIPVVVGMQHTIRDNHAVVFAKGLYGGLADSNNIDTAVYQGRTAIQGKGGISDRDFGGPVVFMRGDAGVLFPPGFGWLGLNALMATLAVFVFALWLSLHFKPHISQIQALLAGLGLFVGLVTILGPIILAYFKRTVWAPREGAVLRRFGSAKPTLPIAAVLVAMLTLLATTRSVYVVQEPQHEHDVEVNVERQIAGKWVDFGALSTTPTDRISGFVWPWTNPAAAVRFDVKRPVATSVRESWAQAWPSTVIDVPDGVVMKRTRVVRLVLNSTLDAVVPGRGSPPADIRTDLQVTINGAPFPLADIRQGVVILGAAEPELREWTDAENADERTAELQRCLIEGAASTGDDLLIRWSNQVQYLQTPSLDSGDELTAEVVTSIADRQRIMARIAMNAEELVAGKINTKCVGVLHETLHHN